MDTVFRLQIWVGGDKQFALKKFIRDYLADGHGRHAVKGRLYDLRMMLNTFNGRIYELEQLLQMLAAAGLKSSLHLPLRSDTSIILARREAPEDHQCLARLGACPST
jgi:hypothetical protein